MVKESAGRCPICDKDVSFRSEGPYWRGLLCSGCRSSPRNRALWIALNAAFPNWRTLKIHESSPGWDIVSQKLASECTKYTATHFQEDIELGSLVTDTKLPCRRYYIQNLERQTFEDQCFDLVVSQDVFEHIFDPLAAIAEIERTLVPGGATIMTVPVVRKFRPSQRRAKFVNDTVEHLLPPEYHGNPVSGTGALVTIDWGYDIAAQLAAASGMYFVMQTLEQPDFGIRDEWNQVLVGYKAPLPALN